MHANLWLYIMTDMCGISHPPSAPVLPTQQRDIVCVSFCVSICMYAAVASACLHVLNLCVPRKAAMWLVVYVYPFSVA